MKIRIAVERGEGEFELVKDMLKPEPNVIGSQRGTITRAIQDAMFRSLDLIESAVHLADREGK